MAKQPTTKMKSQPMQWEKIFANHISNKALIYKKKQSFPGSTVVKNLPANGGDEGDADLTPGYESKKMSKTHLIQQAKTN